MGGQPAAVRHQQQCQKSDPVTEYEILEIPPLHGMYSALLLHQANVGFWVKAVEHEEPSSKAHEQTAAEKSNILKTADHEVSLPYMLTTAIFSDGDCSATVPCPATCLRRAEGMSCKELTSTGITAADVGRDISATGAPGERKQCPWRSAKS